MKIDFKASDTLVSGLWYPMIFFVFCTFLKKICPYLGIYIIYINLAGGMDENLMKRIKVATKLDDKEILQRYKTFNKQFRKGRVSSRAFRKMSLQVLEETEIDEFVSNVFFIFDVGESGYLSFEKFTLATEMANISGNVLDKLSWLFDHVYYYDEVCIIIITYSIDTSILHAIILKIVSFHDLPIRAAWAGHLLLGRLKQL